jgi:hypothetical protein
MTAPDPMKGLRGVYAATLTLEAIVVALSLLVLAKFGEGATPFGVTVIVALAVAMIVAAGVQRRPWGLWFALGLQAVMILCGRWSGLRSCCCAAISWARWPVASCRASRSANRKVLPGGHPAR